MTEQQRNNLSPRLEGRVLNGESDKKCDGVAKFADNDERSLSRSFSKSGILVQLGASQTFAALEKDPLHVLSPSLEIESARLRGATSNSHSISTFKNYKQNIVSKEVMKSQEPALNNCCEETKKASERQSDRNINKEVTYPYVNKSQTNSSNSQNSCQKNGHSSTLATIHDNLNIHEESGSVLKQHPSESNGSMQHTQLTFLICENEALRAELERTQEEANSSNQRGKLYQIESVWKQELAKEHQRVRDLEGTTSRQAVEISQLRQGTQQLELENKQLQSEMLKNKAESFQKYEDLKQSNEELLEAYEERFACQLKLITDDYATRISALEAHQLQEDSYISKLQEETRIAKEKAAQTEKDNVALQAKIIQLTSSNEQLLTIQRFIDMHQQQYLTTLSKNIVHELQAQTLHTDSFQPRIASSQSQYQHDSIYEAQQQDAPKSHYQKSEKQLPNHSQSIQNIPAASNLAAMMKNTSLPRQQQRQVAAPTSADLFHQSFQQQKPCFREQNRSPMKCRSSDNFSSRQVVAAASPSTEKLGGNCLTDDSLTSASQKISQSQFQLELGAAQDNQQNLHQNPGLHYSYSTQVTKRNHYLQQNISHRHYPSQASVPVTVQKKPPSDHPIEENNSTMLQELKQPSLFKHDIIKGLLQTLSCQTGVIPEQNSVSLVSTTLLPLPTPLPRKATPTREQDSRNQSKHIQAKKKKKKIGKASDHQHSFYNTINTSSSSQISSNLQLSKAYLSNQHGQVEVAQLRKSTMKQRPTNNNPMSTTSDGSCSSLSHSEVIQQLVPFEQEDFLGEQQVLKAKFVAPKKNEKTMSPLPSNPQKSPFHSQTTGSSTISSSVLSLLQKKLPTNRSTNKVMTSQQLLNLSASMQSNPSFFHHPQKQVVQSNSANKSSSALFLKSQVTTDKQENPELLSPRPPLSSRTMNPSKIILQQSLTAPKTGEDSSGRKLDVEGSFAKIFIKEKLQTSISEIKTDEKPRQASYQSVTKKIEDLPQTAQKNKTNIYLKIQQQIQQQIEQDKVPLSSNDRSCFK